MKPAGSSHNGWPRAPPKRIPQDANSLFSVEPVPRVKTARHLLAVAVLSRQFVWIKIHTTAGAPPRRLAAGCAIPPDAAGTAYSFAR